MRTENTFGIDFIIRLDKKNKAHALLFARVTVDGIWKEILLKQRINTAHWDCDPERVKVKGLKYNR